MQKNKPRTLVLLFNNKGQILLGKKKYGLGKGYWNGFGGKIEQGETVLEAAVRELEEESGIVLSENELELKALLKFNWIANPEQNYDGLVYVGNYNGNDFFETEEMIPQWWDIDKIPYDQMWDDDKYWLPVLLDGKYIEFQANFSDDVTLQNYEIVTDEKLFFAS